MFYLYKLQQIYLTGTWQIWTNARYHSIKHIGTTRIICTNKIVNKPLKLQQLVARNRQKRLYPLGQAKDSYSSLLVPFRLNKLPIDICKTLTREHISTDHFGDLRRCIFKEVVILKTGKRKEIVRAQQLFSTET